MRRLFGVSGICGTQRVRQTMRTFIHPPGRPFLRRRDASAFLKQSTYSSAFIYSLRWQSSSTDYYSALGVKPDASADEIKAAYKKLALQYHPDRNSDPGAEEMFKKISEAYNTVGNKQRRKEYDMTRGGPFGGFGGSAAAGGSPRGKSYGRADPRATAYHNISKDEADRLFRDIFGGMNVDQIFRNLEEEMQRNHTMEGRRGRVSKEFSGQEQVFRPFFRSESTRVYTDQHGNKMEERTFTDPRGTSFKVRTTTSEQPNASTNYKKSEYYSEKGETSNDGRFHYGNSSFKVNPRGFTDDFGKAYFNVRTHGRHPLVAMLIIAAWTTIIGTILFGTFAFLFSHPFFFLAVFVLLFMRRARFF